MLGLNEGLLLGMLLFVGKPLGREVNDGIIVGVILGFDEG